MAAFLDRYLQILGGMGTHPDKMTINQLTLMAGDVLKGTVPQVKTADLVGAVESKLLRARPEEKLPIIYLMDSIMFNVRSDYPFLFSQKIQSLFMDTFRSGDDDVKKRLTKLLDQWQIRRPEHGALPSRAIGEILAKLKPNFDLEAFVREHERKYQPIRPPPPVAPPHATVSYPPQRPSLVSQQQYDELLNQKAAVILNELQNTMNVPLHERISMHEVYRQPHLLQQVFDTARNELYDEGIRVQPPRTPSPAIPHHPPIQQPMPPIPPPNYIGVHLPPGGLPPPGGIPPPGMLHPPFNGLQPQMMGISQQTMYPPVQAPQVEQPKEPNWSGEYLKDSSGVESMVIDLHMGGSSSRGMFEDAVTGLHFETQDSLNRYKIEQTDQHKTLSASKHSSAILSRNWFNTQDEWTKGTDQILVVEGAGFQDDDELGTTAEGLDAELQRQNSSSSINPELYVVPVDEAYSTCQLTGETFERALDEDMGTWVYQNAIRPDPNGPIYLASAYLEQKNLLKRERESDSDSGPIAKLAKT